MTPLRFFRKYNKWILVVGVSILMIAFLIGPTLQMFAPKPQERVIGTIADQEVKLRDHENARRELSLLRAVHWPLAFFALDDRLQDDGTSTSEAENAMKWLLMRHGATAMGLSASDAEVSELLRLLDIKDDRVTDDVRIVLRNWITVQHYKELLYGRSHVAPKDRLEMYQEAAWFLQVGYVPGYRMKFDSAQGTHRISRPLLERFINDQNTKVRISAIPIRADHFLSQIETSDPEELNELFQSYRDKLPGEGEPYGFGYRVPDRVKLEYLALPVSRLREAVQVEEADLLIYYDENLEEFKAEAPEASEAGAPTVPAQSLPATKPYEEVRDQIIDRIKEQRAQGLGQKMVIAARAIFEQQNRELKGAGGYKVLPPDFMPLPLSTVATDLRGQFGVQPVVVDGADRWLDREGVGNLPSVGRSAVSDDRSIRFADYVFSAKELEPEVDELEAEDTELDAQGDDRLDALWLQVKIPSVPLINDEGSFYIFRLLDAKPTRRPEHLDEARDQVEADAKILAAYYQLVTEAASWNERIKTEPLEDLAAELDATVLTPPPFPKRQINLRGVPEAPEIPGIGRRKKLVDHVFEMTQKVGESDIESAAMDLRVAVIEVPETLSVYIVRLDDYTPITRSEYDEGAKSPFLLDHLAQSLATSLETDGDNPLSIEVLSEHVGFVPVGAESPEQDEG